MTRVQIDYFVLDTLANDLESLSDVVRLINHETIGWRTHNANAAFDQNEVLLALHRCIRDGLVDVFSVDEGGKELVKLPTVTVPALGVEGYWFGLTGAGRLVHANWEPGDP